MATEANKELQQKESKKADKVACQYCGKEYSPRGVTNHEIACSENPKNKELMPQTRKPKEVIKLGSMKIKHN